jgi:dCTP deaminase
MAAGLQTDEDILHRISLTADDSISKRLRLRIEPFNREQLKKIDGRVVIGSGLSGAGYDIKLGRRFRPVAMTWDQYLRTLNNWRLSEMATQVVMDPKHPDKAFGDEFQTDEPFEVPAGGCLLGESVERMRIPEDWAGHVLGKSTLARAFVNLNMTLLEPGWEGTVTIEIVNLNPVPLVIYPGEGIAQVVFNGAERPCVRSYNRRPEAAYQSQNGPTLPRCG